MQRVPAALPVARPALRPSVGRHRPMLHATAGGTSFDQYLHDIQRLPLITDVEEERRLARRARCGDPDAAERLVTANLRFVISYVKRYQGRGLELSDLVAIGNEGLLKAVRKFDPDQGVKFISYAVWWVRQAVLKALAEQTRAVRVPLNQNTALIRTGRAHAILAQQLGRDPTDDELGELLGESPEVVRQCRQLATAEIALDAPIDRGAREAGTFGERIADERSADAEDALSERLVRDQLQHAIRHHLTPRERRILVLYYGLEPGTEEMTLERIGVVMGVTRERIRQIRERAFAKLRESADGPALSGYWTAA